MKKPKKKKISVYNKNEIITQCLKKLIKDHGGIVPPALVVEDAAKYPIGHPYHDHFTWDDAKAAQERRIEQARDLLRVTVEYIPLSNGSYKEMRVATSLSSDRTKSGGYRATVEILGSKEMSTILMADAIRELKMFQRKYYDLKELTGVFAEIEKLITK